MSETELKNMHCRNVANFEKMQSDFPWLHVTLNYKRKVIGAPHGQEIFLDESFSFPLHKAAGDLIHACYKLPDSRKFYSRRPCLCVPFIFTQSLFMQFFAS